MTQQSVTLNPGESKIVSFEVVPTVAKTYNVSVDGLSGSFRAITPLLSFTIEIVGLSQGMFVWYPEGRGIPNSPIGQNLAEGKYVFPIGQMQIDPKYATGKITAFPLDFMYVYTSAVITVKNGDWVRFNVITKEVTIL